MRRARWPPRPESNIPKTMMLLCILIVRTAATSQRPRTERAPLMAEPGDRQTHVRERWIPVFLAERVPGEREWRERGVSEHAAAGDSRVRALQLE